MDHPERLANKAQDAPRGRRARGSGRGWRCWENWSAADPGVLVREAAQKRNNYHLQGPRLCLESKATARQLARTRAARSAVDVADQGGKKRRRSKTGRDHPYVAKTP